MLRRCPSLRQKMFGTTSMRGKDKPPGSEAPPEAPTVRPSAMEEGLPRPSPVSGSNDERTIFRPMPARRSPQTPADVADRTRIRPNPGLRRPTPSNDAAQPARVVAPRRAASEETEFSVKHDNPLLQAAAPLLLLLGRLRAALVRAPTATLAPQIIQSIGRFETEIAAAGVSAAEAEKAKYFLCITADEALANLPGSESQGDRQAASGSVVRHFFGNDIRSERFFELVNNGADETPALLELQHACLALVFVGNSRVLGATAAALQKSRHDLYEHLQKSGAAAPKALSPHWQGLALPAPAVRLQIPFWAVTGVVGMALFALYLMLRTVLNLQAEDVAHMMRQLAAPASPGSAYSDVAAPPPTAAQTAQLERIRKILAPNIAAGTISVEPTVNQVVIRITDRIIFPPDRATVLDEFRPIAMYVALAIDGDKGTIKVIDHTDDAPVASGHYASNFELSLDRAKAVAALIKRSLTQPDRVVVEGKGPDEPIAPDSTPEGRAKNRRIEVIIPRSN
jgi:type VI secretion system protein ImpK